MYFLNIFVISFFSPFPFFASETFKRKKANKEKNSTEGFRAVLAQFRTPQNGFAQFLRSSELHRRVSRSSCAVQNSTEWVRAGLAQLEKFMEI